MADNQTPPLYDVDRAMREIARARRKRDELTRQQGAIADNLATHLDRHFSAEELETAGRALLIGAASVAALVSPDIPPAVIANVLAFAGDRLVRDGRAITATPIEEKPSERA